MRIFKIFLIILCLVGIFSPTFTNTYAFGGPVTSTFSVRYHPIYGYQHQHSGVDIGIDEGTNVPSLTDGTVVYADWMSGYGNTVIVNAPGSDAHFLYAHLSGYAVSEGDYVSKDQIIAFSGSTGNSTGPHLHVTLYYGDLGNLADPMPQMLASGWDLSGDLSGNTTGGVPTKKDNGWFPSVSMDFDWTQYFKPSTTISDSAQKVFNLFTKAMETIRDLLLPLLIVLCVLDFLWYLAKVMMDIEKFVPERFIPKLIRYGFFVGIWKAWRTLFSDIFMPTFEGIGGTFGGTHISATELLSFDTFYNHLSSILSNYMKMHWDVTDLLNFPSFLFSNIVVLFILAISILTCLYILIRISYFYVICIFGVLGIPISFIPILNVHAGQMLGGVLRYILELAMLAALFSIMLSQLGTMQAVPKDSIPSLLMFAVEFTLFSYFLKNASKWGSHFAGRFSL